MKRLLTRRIHKQYFYWYVRQSADAQLKTDSCTCGVKGAFFIVLFSRYFLYFVCILIFLSFSEYEENP